MATQALYNKWRAQTFDEILGQEHITQTLRNQIKAGRIGHAYLFTGLRGTGKTSTARILAKAVNCIGDTDEPPCNQCHICQSITHSASLDLIEIDAASNRGIDEIRDLRDRVHFAPHECRYKVYVIDEVHMLTNEAFNALLKTLEEPPPHVIFVLCTTEPHRLPDTILSRCQRFDFRRVALGTLMQKLRLICQQEGIAITPEALEFIARRATGSFRDAESLLDQLAVYGAEEITLELVQRALGSVPWALVTELVESLVTGDLATGLRAINRAIDDGAEPRQFLSDILDHLRALLLLAAGGEQDLDYLGEESVAAMRSLLGRDEFSLHLVVEAIKCFNEAAQTLRYADRPQLPLELAFVEVVLQRNMATQESSDETADSSPDGQAMRHPPLEATIAPRRASTSDDGGMTSPQRVPRGVAEQEAPAMLPAQEPSASSGGIGRATQEMPATYGDSSFPQSEIAVPVEAEAPASEAPSAQEVTLDWVRQHWPLILLKANARSKQVRALLNSAYPVAVCDLGNGGAKITLGCEATFHRDMLSDDKRRVLLEKVFTEVLDVPCHLACAVHDGLHDLTRNEPQPPDEPADLFDTSGRAERLKQELLNHPVVKELQKRGGRVTNVRVFGQDEIGR